MQKEKVILILSASGASNAINAVSRQIEDMFLDAGRNTYFVDVEQPEVFTRVQDAMLNYDVEFVFSYMGIGSDFFCNDPVTGERVNVWEHFGIPFLRLQGDSPAYFISRHGTEPATAINIYATPEFAEVQSWYFGDQKIPYIICPPLIFDCQPAEQIDFSRRKQGTLVFLKNGNDPNQLIDLWEKNLPAGMVKDLFELGESLLPSLLKCEPVNLFESIRLHVAERIGNEHACRDLIRLYLAQLDDFFRRIKSTLVAEALKGFPVKIIGKNWEHVDDGTSVAKFSNDINFATHSREIFSTELGLIDMTPNMEYGVHDRFCRAAGNHAFILTNKTIWMEQNMPELSDSTYVFDQEQIGLKVEFLLNNRELVVERGRLLGKLAAERIGNQDFVHQLIEVAEKMKFLRQPNKPRMQDFYVW